MHERLALAPSRGKAAELASAHGMIRHLLCGSPATRECVCATTRPFISGLKSGRITR